MSEARYKVAFRIRFHNEGFPDAGLDTLQEIIISRSKKGMSDTRLIEVAHEIMTEGLRESEWDRSNIKYYLRISKDYKERAIKDNLLYDRIIAYHFKKMSELCK